MKSEYEDGAMITRATAIALLAASLAVAQTQPLPVITADRGAEGSFRHVRNLAGAELVAWVEVPPAEVPAWIMPLPARPVGRGGAAGPFPATTPLYHPQPRVIDLIIDSQDP